MSLKILPMPKIELKDVSAECLDFVFGLAETNDLLVYKDNNDTCCHYEKVDIKPNQTFEQAVTEWVKNWVKENFEPIILPDCEDNDEDRLDPFDYYGYHKCKEHILELNKNIIKVEE